MDSSLILETYCYESGDLSNAFEKLAVKIIWSAEYLPGIPFATNDTATKKFNAGGDAPARD